MPVANNKIQRVFASGRSAVKGEGRDVELAESQAWRLGRLPKHVLFLSLSLSLRHDVRASVKASVSEVGWLASGREAADLISREDKRTDGRLGLGKRQFQKCSLH